MQQANEKYERELLAHAEALKQINQLKSTINDLQKKVRNAKPLTGKRFERQEAEVKLVTCYIVLILC